jgi:hypothetical protein
MHEAIVVLSRKGFCQTKITATEVRSREHARKLWPLVAPADARKLVTWSAPLSTMASFEGDLTFDFYRTRLTILWRVLTTKSMLDSGPSVKVSNTVEPNS